MYKNIICRPTLHPTLYVICSWSIFIQLEMNLEVMTQAGLTGRDICKSTHLSLSHKPFLAYTNGCIPCAVYIYVIRRYAVHMWCSLLVHVHHPYPMHNDNSWCSVACARLPTLFHINKNVRTAHTDNMNHIQHTLYIHKTQSPHKSHSEQGASIVPRPYFLQGGGGGGGIANFNIKIGPGEEDKQGPTAYRNCWFWPNLFRGGGPIPPQGKKPYTLL